MEPRGETVTRASDGDELESSSFMSASFEELDRTATPMGELSVRRRIEPSLQVEVYEIKLGDEFLMSSLFTVAEIALAQLALDQIPGRDLDVLVGGLGLGYTARAVLQDHRVRSLQVVEVQDAVIEWHQQHLLPLSPELMADSRCRLVNGDFFATLADGAGFGADPPDGYHAVLVDIDHSPTHLLHPSHRGFYEVAGLVRIAELLRPGGVFALWSDDPPDRTFVASAEEAFGSCAAHVVTFPNFYTGEESASTVYVALRRGARSAKS